MRARRGIAATALGGLMVVVPLGVAPASADDQPEEFYGGTTIATHCYVGNINNGVEWTGYPGSGSSQGHAHFREYGDILEVVDTDSNGKRIYVVFDRCDTPGVSVYNSGPNEGPTDVETFNFELTEGLRVAFRTCEGSATTACGPWVEANA